MPVERHTATTRDVRAGCFLCHGMEARWIGAQAQGTAALHHDRTRHPTWCDVVMTVRYGEATADPRQIDIEDSIAASASSGGAPGSAPLPDPDAPTVPAADVSAALGRPVETSRSMRGGARGRKPEPAYG